jgi:hypothetical protein
MTNEDNYIILAPDESEYPTFKRLYIESIERHNADIQEIDEFIASNELSYTVEQALYAGIDVLQGHIDALNDSVAELERCGY